MIKNFASDVMLWLTGARHPHDRWLVLSMTGFNFAGGWEQLLRRNQMRDWR